MLSNKRISPDKSLLPLLNMLAPLIMTLPEILLSIDRTDWKQRGVPVNILSVSIYIYGRTIPLYWKVKNQSGNSSLEEQKEVIQPVLDVLRSIQQLKNMHIHVVGDREFSSPKLPAWLFRTYKVDSTFRIKKSFYLSDGQRADTKVADHLSKLKRGQSKFLKKQIVTKNSDFPLNVILIWISSYHEPIVIMTTLKSKKKARNYYSKRFGIEPMHKDYKSNIYDIEGTRVTNAKRIETLIIPIALALALGMLEGVRREREQETTRAHKKQRSVGLAWEGIRAFTKAFRATTIDRIEAFWQQLFSYYNFTWINYKIPI